MDVQKYIKRLKFARADMSRATGPFETRDEAIEFLNQREFFFGDPFVVKFKDREDNGEVKLLLAIGKSTNPEIGPDTTEVTGGVGPDAYELIDVSDIKDELEKLWEALNEEISARTQADEVLQENIDAEASARTAADEHLQEEIDEVKDAIDVINGLIDELSGATEALEEIVGEGWTDAPDNVTITDRIKRDEQLAGIVWGHNDGEPYDGKLPETDLKYASGESIAEMIKSISETLSGVLFEDDNKTKAIKFEYNPERNILYYTAGTETNEIELSQAAVVDRAYYDAETEELVIIFKLGEGKTQEVRIPVGSLITEWDVVDTNTVHLEKERVAGGGSDKLSAEVKISDDADNMLVAKQDGLYISNSGLTKVEEVLGVVKEDLAVLEDGHFPADYFSGSTVNGSTNIQEAILKLDENLVGAEGSIDALASAITATHDELDGKIEEIKEELPKLKTEVKLKDDVSHLTLESGYSADGHVFYELGESDIASESSVNDAINGVQTQIDDLVAGLGDEVTARETIKLVELPAQALEDDVRAAYVLDNNGNTGDTVIKIYKDSFIYKVYIGHVDDKIVSPTDPTVVPGTGATAVCFIYFNAKGEYELTANPFEWTALDDEIAAREAGDVALAGDIQSLRDELGEFEADTNQAIADLEDKASIAITGVTNASDSAIVLAKESDNTVSGDVKVSADAKNMLEKLSDGNLFVNNSGVTRANELCDTLSGITGNFRLLLNTGEDGHFTARFVGPHVSSAETYYNAINALDSAIVAAGNASRDTANSFKLEYDKDAQEIALKWEVDGTDKESKIDVSDFVKDSFLEEVQIITREGVQYLEFRFKTYDGEPVPIYVPLSDFAVIYHAGDGIDARELDDNQVITVKIDPMHEGEKSWLAKSEAGLRVTGVTEAIEEAVSGFTHLVEEEAAARAAADETLQGNIDAEASARESEDERLWEALSAETRAREEADNDLLEKYESLTDLISGVTGETLSDYVRKDEVEDHLDSASTLPVQNAVVTGALKDLRDDIDEVIESLSAFTADTIVTNELTATTANFDNITANTIVTNEISGENADFTNITAQTIYADEYQNLPTATTDQYGVVILDDHLDTGSTNPVENTVVASAFNDVNDEIDDLKGQISAITDTGLYDVEVIGSGNVVTSIEKDGNSVVATLGSIVFDVDDELDSASTNPVENKVLYQIITDNEETIAAALNDLNNRKADLSDIEENYYDKSEVDELIDNIDLTNITANTIYASEYQNLPTATTSQYGVVVVDDHFDSASTNPVENSVVANAVDGINDEIDDLKGQISAITDSGLYEVRVAGSGNVLTNISKDGTAVVGTLGNIDVKTFAGQELLGTGEVVKTLHVGPYHGQIQIAFKGNTNNEFPVFSALVTIPDHNFAALIEADEDNAVAFDYSDGEKGWVSSLCKVTVDPVGWNGYGLEINWSEPSITESWSGDINITPLSGNLNLDRIDEDYSAMYPTDLEYQQKVVRYEKADNKVAEITSASTDNQYPSAKAVYDAVSNIEIDVDDQLDSASTNPVENRAIYKVIVENEVVTSAALNDLNDRVTNLSDVTVAISLELEDKADKDYVDEAIEEALSGITFDVDDHLDSASTNPVENRVLEQIIRENEYVTSSALNDLNNRFLVLSGISENAITGATQSGSGNVVTSITVNDNVLTAALGDASITIDTALSSSSTNPVENRVVNNAIEGLLDNLSGYLPLSGGTMTGNISGNTGVAFYAPGGFFQQSDERSKIFIGDIEDALEKANKIPTRYFYWKESYDGPRQLGTSAQKVQEIFPEIVSGDDKLSVDYSKLAVVALAAIKELTAKVEDLQRQIDELKK